jgi:hypothetical protein
MTRWLVPGAVVAAAAVAWLALAGCETTRPAAEPPAVRAETAALARLQPETQSRMKAVMTKIGAYYELLETSVAKGSLAQAATEAEAIASLGSYLAPQRDPRTPARYLTLQARFDESARELAAAARLKSIHEVTQSFDELRKTCQECHAAFRVKLPGPYRGLGFVEPDKK